MSQQYCRPKFGLPFIRYRSGHPEELNTFLVANGGEHADIQEKGKAMILNRKKGADDRFIYMMPGSYLRCLTPGQFSVVNSREFEAQFEIIKQ